MARKAAELMKGMSPDQLAEMTRSASDKYGMSMTPEMAKMAADMMSNMGHDEIAKMHEMAAAMQSNGGARRAAATAAAAGALAGINSLYHSCLSFVLVRTCQVIVSR